MAQAPCDYLFQKESYKTTRFGFSPPKVSSKTTAQECYAKRVAVDTIKLKEILCFTFTSAGQLLTALQQSLA